MRSSGFHYGYGLHNAAIEAINMVDFLIEHGANANAKDRAWWPPAAGPLRGAELAASRRYRQIREQNSIKCDEE
jgi:hypothetical protein